MRKVQDKMDGVVPEVIDLTSEDGEGKEAIGDVLGSPFLDLGPLNESEEIERVVTHMYTVGFEGPVASQ